MATYPLLARIREYERAINQDIYDVDTWQLMLIEINSWPVINARPIYERFLKIFPTAARYWKQYVEHELRSEEFKAVEDLFQRCLLKVMDLDLWCTYLAYIRRIKGGTPEEKTALEEAYEFIFKHLHYDLNILSIFPDYIALLQSFPATKQLEEGLKITKIRKAYQRAISWTSNGVEAVWREWDQFEHNLNATIAQGLLRDNRSKHDAASSVARDRKRRSKGIEFNSLPRPVHKLASFPPKTSDELFTVTSAQQVNLHRRLLAYETSNPLHLPPHELRPRVIFLYKQSLLSQYHSAYLWFELLQTAQSLGAKDDEMSKLYNEAREAIHYNVVFTFLHAEWEEEQKRPKEARAIYEFAIEQRLKERKFLEQLRESSVKSDESNTSQKTSSAEDADPIDRTYIVAESDEFTFNRLKTPLGLAHEYRNKEKSKYQNSTSDGVPVLEPVVDTQQNGTSKNTSDEYDELSSFTVFSSDDAVADEEWNVLEKYTSKIITLMYLQFIRFVRRCESVENARKVFVLARRFLGLSYHAYVFAATLEWQCNNSIPFASKIFQIGLEKYENETEFALHYEKYLYSIHDHANLRVLVERMIKDSERVAIEEYHKEEVERARKNELKKKRTSGRGEEEASVSKLSLWDFGVDHREQVNLASLSAFQSGISTAAGNSQLPFPSGSPHYGSLLNVAPGFCSQEALLWYAYVELDRLTATELSAIVKTEDRREIALRLYSPKLAIVIDRHRYLDLWPCSMATRHSIELISRPDLVTETLNLKDEGITRLIYDNIETDRKIRQSQITKPDLSHFQPFDPFFDRKVVRHRYGAVPLPDCILSVLSQLPRTFVLPTYNIDSVIQQLTIPYPDTNAFPNILENADTEVIGGPAAAPPVAMDTTVNATAIAGDKRRRGDDEDDTATPSSGASDLFGLRRQQKLAKQ